MRLKCREENIKRSTFDLAELVYRCECGIDYSYRRVHYSTLSSFAYWYQLSEADKTKYIFIAREIESEFK